MAPLLRMVGVKRSRIPNSLNTTVTTFEPDPAWSVGNGNSPPARKYASLPGSVIRFGSARLRKSPRCFANWISASMLELRLLSAKPIVTSWDGEVSPRQSPLSLILCGLSVERLAAQSLSTVRLISAKRTCSITCTAGGV